MPKRRITAEEFYAWIVDENARIFVEGVRETRLEKLRQNNNS